MPRQNRQTERILYVYGEFLLEQRNKRGDVQYHHLGHARRIDSKPPPYAYNVGS